MCARWVHRNLAAEHKADRKVVPPPELLTCFKAEGETFPSLIFIADEARVHNFEPETKRQSVYGTIQICPEEKLQKYSVNGQGHDYCLVSYEVVILVDVMPRGDTTPAYTSRC